MTQQRQSAIIAKAQLELANLKAINPSLDLGEGLSIAALAKLVKETQDAIAQFNTAMATMATQRQLIRDKEAEIADLSQRIRLGVGARYGQNSQEYRLAKQAGKRGRNSKSEEQPAEGKAISNGALLAKNFSIAK